MVKWYAKVVCGVLISVAAVGVVPGGEAMQKCGYYPGYTFFAIMYPPAPQNTFADFADF